MDETKEVPTSEEVTREVEGFDLRGFVRFYAEAVLDLYITHRDNKARIVKQLEKELDKTVREVKVHHDGEVHVYFTDGDHEEYTVKDLGLTDRF